MGLCVERKYYTREQVLIELAQKKPIIIIDHPKGSRKGFGDQSNLVELPFDYGELPQYLNVCDDMGWDVIITPSSCLKDELHPVGIAIVNTDFNEWKKRIPNSKKLQSENPVGNDKIIFATNGRVTEEDRSILEGFCFELWQFERIDWF